MTVNSDPKPWWHTTIGTGWGGAINAAGGVLGGVMVYSDRQNTHPGENKLASAMYGAVDTAAWFYMPEVMWAKTALQMGKGIGSMVQQHALSMYEKQYASFDMRGVVGNGFQDTDVAYTARQRGMQAIQSSRLNARSALANEARSLHRL